MPPRLLVVQHEPGCPLALFAGWLAAAGCVLDVRRAWAEPLPDMRGYAGLLVLGGAMDADDDAGHPWLPATRDLIAQAGASGVPTLGICLGLQLAALAFGGAVEPNPCGPTIGLRQVDWEPDVLFDPLLCRVAGEDRGVHFNTDVVVDLPPTGTLLATTLDGSVAAARLAPTVWGVQFHPEADAAVVAGWAAASGPALARAELSAEEVVGAVDRAAAELTRTWRPLAEAFGAMVRGRASAVDLLGS